LLARARGFALPRACLRAMVLRAQRRAVVWLCGLSCLYIASAAFQPVVLV